MRLESSNGRSITALVEGTTTYDVSLTLDDRAVIGACTCRRFLNGVACKHLWAVICVARTERRWFSTEPEEFELDWAAIDEWESTPPQPVAPHREVTWREQLSAQEGTFFRETPVAHRLQHIVYLVDTARSKHGLTIEIGVRERKASGEWGRVKTSSSALSPDATDRQVMAMMRGCYSPYYYGEFATAVPVGTPLVVPAPLYPTLLPLLCATGRCYARDVRGDVGQLLAWDTGDPWRFSLRLTHDDATKMLDVRGVVGRGAEERPVEQLTTVLPGGLYLHEGRLGLLDDGGAATWLRALHERGVLHVPVSDVDDFYELTVCRAPDLVVEVPTPFTKVPMVGRPRVSVSIRSASGSASSDKLRLTMAFDYEGQTVDLGDPRRAVLGVDGRSLVVRDTVAEQEALEALVSSGVRREPAMGGGPPAFDLTAKRLPEVVRALLARGWEIEAHGRRQRRATDVAIRVRSGIDWFDVEGTVRFGEATVSLGAILAASRKGLPGVPLGDGTVGLLPEEWLARHGFVAGMGEIVDERLRYRRHHAWLLDELLAALPSVSVDEQVARLRAELETFERIEPDDPAATFSGTLRGYQREAIGWMQFLERFGFGGCLADDMGLGKTVQVLAHLDKRRASGRAQGPSIVVVPKSLVFNWKAEAARFVPDVRVVDYTGASRAAVAWDSADLVITTYGTLRRDAVRLADVSFDYAILDEAHSIKNAASASAKAARALKARHRLALSGTPVQNHIGDLYSLFDFLNPGLLGQGRATLRGAERRSETDDTILARGLKPFILRRTKSAVAPELPARTEQTVFCELGGGQRAVYETLRQHYHATLGGRIKRVGLARAKMHVLEALLRLRQAACHPGLVHDRFLEHGSVKIEVLLARLDEAREEGRKSLVFSQFTSLLALVRPQLEAKGVTYEYLDGRTRDREVRVRRFQEDPACSVFLISLKAGGLGLNLTAADAVFLLDPWWNPAIEAQAIDRTHRIGQTSPVFAWRLIARDTVEEKILDLQARKRELADSLVAGDGTLLSELSLDDLELLIGA